MIRSFVAIELDEGLKRELHKVQLDLADRIAPGTVRWTRPEGIHLTLQFLGEVAEGRIGAITDALREACRPFAPFSFQVEGLGCFPDLRHPRVVWVGVNESTGALRALHQAVSEALRPLGFRPDKAFHPHLTLGRAKRGASREAIQALGTLIQKARLAPLGHVEVHEVHLMRSDLQPSGAVYSCLSVARLEGERGYAVQGST